MTQCGMDWEIAKEVGFYAMTGDRFNINIGKEFVAEVFAGMLTGKKFSKKVMSVYNALGGPKISGLTNEGVLNPATSGMFGPDIFVKKSPVSAADSLKAQKLFSLSIEKPYVSQLYNKSQNSVKPKFAQTF